MRTESRRWTRGSLLISLVVHGIAFIFFALYVTGTATKVQEFVHTVFVPETKPQKYEPKPQLVRPITRPSAPQTPIVETDVVPVDTPKRSSPLPGRRARTTAPFRVADETLQDTVSPSPLTKDRIAPRVATVAEVLPSALSLPSSGAGGSSGPVGIGSKPGVGGAGTGGGGGQARSILAATKPPPDRQSLSMIRTNAALTVDEGLTEVAKGVTLGATRVPPLPRGQPGGIVVGRGKDIEGYIRFTRIKHYLADWWADPTAMPGVIYWMNNQTKVRADMNIEGGALTFDDPKLMRCPLAIMTGHDRALLSQRLQGNYRNSLTDSERAGLRRYLIEAGGFLFFDECGHDVMLSRRLKGELRAALPEHDIERISNDHELYTCFYGLGGPPPGACRFWKHGTRWAQATQGIRHLEGLFINDRLAAVISERDYLCAARTKNRPGHGYTGEESPSTYRFLTNVIIYSLTHGSISDHSDYVPDMTDADRISIDSPVNVPVLMPE